jgi:hypothetical protein
MIGYIFALLPIYVLLYLPLQHLFLGSHDDDLKYNATTYNASLIASDEPLSCPLHSYNTFILSRQPLIIYIENFLSSEESKHLHDIRYSPPLCLCPFRHFRSPPPSTIHVTNLITAKTNSSPQRSLPGILVMYQSEKISVSLNRLCSSATIR